jgi:hypothetical protein
MSKFQPNALNYGTLHNTYTDTHHTSHYTNTKYQLSYTDILPVSKTPEAMNKNMEEVDEETRLRRRRGCKGIISS